MLAPVPACWLDRSPRLVEKQAVPRKKRTPLAGLANDFTFEPHDIGRQLDASGRYRLPFRREFPLSVRLFHYRAGQFTQGVTWHEQLELFYPVAGAVDVRMGDQLVSLAAGDLLVVDNLKPHHAVDRPGLDARVVVISFLPELVYSLGSSSHDFAFLLPFYVRAEKQPHVLRVSEPAAARASAALEGLVREFAADPAPSHREAACKAWLLSLLIVLTRRFQDSAMMRPEFERRRQLAQRLGRLLDHIQRPGSDRLSLGEAARLSGMSTAQFTRAFKKVSGLSYVAYLTHLRLTEASRMLRLGERKIAEIASLTGFADQSHFDRRFKRAFGQTPRDYQRAVRGHQ